MGYSAKRPYRLFNNEAERQAWINRPELNWKAHAAEVNGRISALIVEGYITRCSDLPLHGTSDHTDAVINAIIAGTKNAEVRLGNAAILENGSFDWEADARATFDSAHEYWANHPERSPYLAA